MDSGDEAAKDDMVVDEDGEVLPDDVVDSGETVVDEAVEAEVEHEIQFAQRFLDEIGGYHATFISTPITTNRLNEIGLGRSES
ncbi:unnamed protein product [Phytophthora fragariaefolia]|uniref:Unnamed protein product n=1 Tax=Phytophthora fragariaefolia TaxID=1490495 RepID=A0A9W7D528_9STRA|nr:unnamed protein product [Phytophthora fragariaefolia]